MSLLPRIWRAGLRLAGDGGGGWMFAVAVINCHIGSGNVWYASDH